MVGQTGKGAESRGRGLIVALFISIENQTILLKCSQIVSLSLESRFLLLNTALVMDKKASFQIPSFSQVEKRQEQQSKEFQEKPKISNPAVVNVQADSQHQEPRAESAKIHVPNPIAPSINPAPSMITRTQPTISRKTPMKVNARQKQNPVVQALRALPFEFTADLHADFLISNTGVQDCAIYFLSLRYHRLNPDYLWSRLGTQSSIVPSATLLTNAVTGQTDHIVRIILIQVDIDDPQSSIRELTKIAIQCQCTIFIGGRDAEDCARVLERYYALHSQPSLSSKQQNAKNIAKLPMDAMSNSNVPISHLAQVVEVLTTIKGVTRRDAVVLLAAFGSWKKLVHASEEELTLCNGIGAKKAKRLWQVFNQPFLLPPD